MVKCLHCHLVLGGVFERTTNETESLNRCDKYEDLIAGHLLNPFMSTMFPCIEDLFQQDNTIYHTIGYRSHEINLHIPLAPQDHQI